MPYEIYKEIAALTEKLCKLGNGDRDGNSNGNVMAQQIRVLLHRLFDTGEFVTVSHKLLLTAAVTLRQLETCKSSSHLPDSFRLKVQEEIDAAAGLRVGMDGTAGFALIGDDIQSGDGEFFTGLSGSEDNRWLQMMAATALLDRLYPPEAPTDRPGTF